jgi:type II secretory pathway pseudopilin PulG
VAIFSLGLAVIGPTWSDDVRRHKERELLKIGSLYATAIVAYRLASPGSLKSYPPSLDSLLIDDRMVGTRRHLRKLYADPLDPSRPWGVVRGPDGTVRGVYSQADAPPMNGEPIELGFATLPAAQRYSDWKFMPKVTE